MRSIIDEGQFAKLKPHSFKRYKGEKGSEWKPHSSKWYKSKKNPSFELCIATGKQVYNVDEKFDYVLVVHISSEKLDT